MTVVEPPGVGSVIAIEGIVHRPGKEWEKSDIQG